MNKRLLTNIITVAICAISIGCTNGQNSVLQKTIERLVKDKDLTVGVAIYNESGEVLASINSDQRFPMQSVYKLPIAMAYLGSDSVNYDSDSVTISKSELPPNTWSPFREAHPNGATVTAAKFVEYIVAKSDNNLCDVMIDLTGGIDSINSHIKRMGVNNITIQNYEREIQSSWEVQFENYATPNAAIEILKHLWSDKQSGSQSSELLWQVMRNTNTGSARKLLSKDTDIGYKTGFSGKSSKGVTAANNCVGIIDRIGSEDIFFAIFISNSSEKEEFNYEVISKIIKAIE